MDVRDIPFFWIMAYLIIKYVFHIITRYNPSDTKSCTIIGSTLVASSARDAEILWRHQV